MARFFNKVALITGATSQIGTATSLSLAKQGCMLALTSSSENVLKDLSHGCIHAGLRPPMVLTLSADLKQENEAESVVSRTVKNFGKLDILINCEEKFCTGSTAATPLNMFDEALRTNTRIIFYMIQLVVPHLSKTRGCIVNVSSIASLRSFPGLMAYGVSKSALDHLTHSAAIELQTQGVRVNGVNPPLYLESHLPSPDQNRNEIQEKSAFLGRRGHVDEVVASIEFLVSDAASFITGVNLAVDGGRSTFCPQQFSEH